MLKSFVFLLRFVLFWIIFFFLERLLFLSYFSGKLEQIPLAEIVPSFLYGLRMDLSMTGYILAVPLLIYLVLWIFPRLHFRQSFFRIYIYSLIILFSLLNVINLNIYREWGSKINARAIDLFFTSTNEALASGSSSPIFLSLLLFIALSTLSIFLARKLLAVKMPREKIPVWQKLLVGLLLIALNFLAIRGGIDASPMNQSMAYYSNKPVLNHASVNTEWNLMQDLIKVRGSKNPYLYFPADEASRIVEDLYSSGTPEQDVRIFNIAKPNVVFIILESFTADVVESLGGEKGVAPNMEKLIAQGLFFKHIYASGDRTDKGLVAILSAFPSQASQSIIKLNAKQEKLPAISSELKKNGYQTSFYYGGQSEFFNIKSYLLSHDFDKLIDKSNFRNESLSSWGVFDHKVFEKNVLDLDTASQPFFSTVLTLSNHEPFQLPGSSQFPGSDPENKFRSTAYYTDASLAAYISEARKKPWFKNTVFIIVADHGHRLPKSIYENYDPSRFRIPLLIFGDALKPEFKGKTVTKTGSQTDIAATLLNQLDISSDGFKWSEDLLNENEGFSFFSWDNGFGFATKEQIISLDNISRTVIYKKNPKFTADSVLIRKGKAYMQQVYQTFLDY